jgi:hypothetical protein
MPLEDEIVALGRRTPGRLTEIQIAKAILPGHAYQQRVNSTCRRLIVEGAIHRQGGGSRSDPFRYHIGKAL